MTTLDKNSGAVVIVLLGWLLLLLLPTRPHRPSVRDRFAVPPLFIFKFNLVDETRQKEKPDSEETPSRPQDR
jgi:hypothetical protein